jgi:anti-anti-sigma factor
MAVPDVRRYKPLGNSAVFIRDSSEDVESLHVFGEVDMAAERDLEKALADSAPRDKPLSVNLTYCTYIDSRGIHVLQKASTKRTLRIVVASDSTVRRILDILHAGDFLSIEYAVVPRLDPIPAHLHLDNP